MYDVKVMLIRQGIALAVSALMALLGKWLAPGTIDALAPHVTAIIATIVSAVFAVDLDAYRASKAEPQEESF